MKLNKCKVCEKTFLTSLGLKVHTSKTHKNKLVQEEDIEIKSEANKIVELLLKEMDHEEIEQEEIPLVEEITLEETAEKTYDVKCDQCEYVATGPKKYFALQLLKKHRESCHQCDFTSNSKIEMKKHMRDQHEVLTDSTSPPQKRKRRGIEKKEHETEPMDCEENKIESVEDMDINEEEVMKKKISDQMDAKVLEKRKLYEEKENEFKKQKKDLIEMKKKEEENEKKVVKETNKKRKQVTRQKSKKINKRIRASEEIKKNKVPNIRNIPENCKHLLNKNDVLYTVPGDGCCGPSSAAAHLFKDEVYGPKLRRKMNLFAAEHYNKGRYQFIFNCSTETPYIRKLGDAEIKFTVISELLEFLKNSEKGAFMWTENEDLAVLSDLYQIRIKIITTKGDNDKNVTENWIYPDPELKQYSELQNVEIDDLVLFNENNVHFNLVVNKDSDLAQLGSLSYRFNVGPIVEDVEKKEEPEVKVQIEEQEEEIDYKKELIRMKKELQESQKSQAYIEKEYKQCEKELKLKTEEVIKLNSEIKDLKQIVNLRSDIRNMNITEGDECDFEPWESKEKTQEQKCQDESKCQVCEKSFKKNSELVEHMKSQHGSKEELNCKICKFQASSNFQLRKHMKMKHTIKCDYCGESFDRDDDLIDHIRDKHCEPDEEFNCEGCDFQTNDNAHLRKHIEIKHEIRCKLCGNKYNQKEELMDHRKSQHPEAVAQCKKYALNICDFSAEKCWWNHKNKTEIDEHQIKCFVCGELFNSIRDLMGHKKAKHRSIVKACANFQQNKCRFNSDFCWFIHEPNINTSEKVSGNPTEKKETQSVFQKERQNPKPPLSSAKKEKKE